MASLRPVGPASIMTNYILISLNYALMILLPVIVAFIIRRRTAAPWRFFFMGAVTFVLSQVLHIPFNILVERSGLLPEDTATWANLLTVAIFAGLSAGVFEEVARYLTYRFWATDGRTWSRGMMLGAGHGGVEAIILGLLGAVSFAGLVAVAGNPAVLEALPEAERAQVTEALATIQNSPWYLLLLGALERAFAIMAHLAMSIMVLQVFLRRNIGWLFMAIGYHALLDAAAVISLNRIGPYATEAVVGVIAVAGLYVAFRLRTPDPAPDESPPPLPPPNTAALDIQPSEETLDRSRYI